MFKRFLSHVKYYTFMFFFLKNNNISDNMSDVSTSDISSIHALIFLFKKTFLILTNYKILSIIKISFGPKIKYKSHQIDFHKIMYNMTS